MSSHSPSMYRVKDTMSKIVRQLEAMKISWGIDTASEGMLSIPKLTSILLRNNCSRRRVMEECVWQARSQHGDRLLNVLHRRVLI